MAAVCALLRARGRAEVTTGANVLTTGLPGRPQSELRVMLAAALIDGGGTCRDLAVRTGGGLTWTRETLNNMVRAGDCRKRYVRVPGVCRPVPFYERAVRASAVRHDAAPLVSLIAAWAQGSMQGAAM